MTLVNPKETLAKPARRRRLTFHVPPDASPAALRALLTVLEAVDQEHPPSRSALLDQMAMHMKSSPRGEAITLAQDTGVVIRSGGSLVGTSRAQALGRLEAQADLIHMLQYFAWSPQAPQALSPYWTYRSVVDLLWDAAPVRLDSATKKRLVEELLACAAATFAPVEGFDPAKTSLSTKSVDGVTRWLQVLTPPVVRDAVIERRQTCSPQLMLVALAAAARSIGETAGSDFRLGPDQRTVLCRACFLAPEHLDRVLDWTVITQPRHVRWGALISTYGRQIVLARTDVGPETFV